MSILAPIITRWPLIVLFIGTMLTNGLNESSMCGRVKSTLSLGTYLILPPTRAATVVALGLSSSLGNAITDSATSCGVFQIGLPVRTSVNLAYILPSRPFMLEAASRLSTPTFSDSGVRSGST